MQLGAWVLGIVFPIGTQGNSIPSSSDHPIVTVWMSYDILLVNRSTETAKQWHQQQGKIAKLPGLLSLLNGGSNRRAVVVKSVIPEGVFYMEFAAGLKAPTLRILGWKKV